VKTLAILFLFVSLAVPMSPQEAADDGPTNEKAQKTYREALDYLHQRMKEAALDAFKKADKQDGGHCLACQRRMVKYALELRDWKTAEGAASALVGEASTPKEQARAHYIFGAVLLNEGTDKHKDEIFSHAHDEFSAALAAGPNFPDAIFNDGLALAHLKQDDAAKARFEQFVNMKPEENPQRQRALRYIAEPDLARARMAPAFAVTTVDGQRISLDDLEGKVVLIDFWATWCGPCRAALPHVQEIAKKFQGQPLVVLSVSVDKDEQTWRQFIAKNEMTWPQYYDGGFTGPIAKLFGVQAIPHTFTVDADGVLQDEHIGDAAIEGKLKKLIKRAQEMPPRPKAEPQNETKTDSADPVVQ
jgi:thiol-disulfide isomerase/thioredoxin